MAFKRDNIHYSTRNIDGYNKPFNFIISEREAGKSTAIWLDKAYKQFKEHGFTTLVVRRKVVHITKAYIDDIEQIINKFTDDAITFEYPLSSIKDGIIDIKIKEKRFMRICALSVDITALKSLVLRDLKTIIFDEFIANPRFGEKYLKDEATKFMEVYNTFRRESINLKCYFMGNPYSLYNPYFLFFDVPTTKLVKGAIFSGATYVVECYTICDKLRSKILAENPLYQFDNAYTKYAFNGININDANIWVMEDKPVNFSLYYIFKISNRYIAVYRNNMYENLDFMFYAEYIKAEDVGKRRNIYCFDFEELISGTIMLSSQDRNNFSKLKSAMRLRAFAFKTIEVYYMLEEIYYNL